MPLPHSSNRWTPSSLEADPILGFAARLTWLLSRFGLAHTSKLPNYATKEDKA